MGRTKRKRKRNKELCTGKNLDNEEPIIALRKWMKTQEFENQTSLRLRDFKVTGRGVFSKRSFAAGDTLIQVPYKLLITYNTIQESELFNIFNQNEEKTLKLKFQDLLILFLIIEKLKGPNSSWCAYIDSLPQEPPWLPLKFSDEDVETLPIDIKEKVGRLRWNAKQTWKRLRKSINASGYEGCVLNVNLFTWAFTMVNTRAVYVDPGIIHDLSGYSDRDLRQVLSDEPCMALCPFLDMFNHSCDAKTVAELKLRVNGHFYELKTLRGFRKYEQIFISYGSHDNVTLFCEYGFFIPWKNMLDSVIFSLDDILTVLSKQISGKHKCFLLERKLNKDLYVGFDGLSFNLKALFYFLLQSDLNIWTTCAYTESYPLEVLEQFQSFAFKLLQEKLQYAKVSLLKMQNNSACKNSLLFDYLKYHVEFISHLYKKYAST